MRRSASTGDSQLSLPQLPWPRESRRCVVSCLSGSGITGIVPCPVGELYKHLFGTGVDAVEGNRRAGGGNRFIVNVEGGDWGLLKIVFLVDYEHFKTYTVSVSGWPYARLPYGPVPQDYDDGTSTAKAGEGLTSLLKDTPFSDNKLETINRVVNR